MGKSILVFALLVLGLAAPAFSDMDWIKDDFDDGSLLSNPNGIGAVTGWNKGTFNQVYIREERGVLYIPTYNEQGNAWIQNKKADNFRVWNSNGATVTWVIKGMTVQTPHQYSVYCAYNWHCGIISSRENQEVCIYTGKGTKGGFYVNFGKKDNSASTSGQIVVVNKTHDGTEEDPSGWLEVSNFTFNVVYPIIATAKLTQNGWTVTINQNTGSAKLSGNWTSDLNVGGINAGITDEFSDSVFVLAHGRNQGINGQGIAFPNAPNSGEMERIGVVLHGVIGVRPSIVRPARATAGFSGVEHSGRVYDCTGALVSRQTRTNGSQVTFSPVSGNRVQKAVKLK